MITDQLMPGMTGLQLVATIRREHRAMPAILASGYSDVLIAPDMDVVRLARPFSPDAELLAHQPG